MKKYILMSLVVLSFVVLLCPFETQAQRIQYPIEGMILQDNANTKVFCSGQLPFQGYNGSFFKLVLEKEISPNNWSTQSSITLGASDYTNYPNTGLTGFYKDFGNQAVGWYRISLKLSFGSINFTIQKREFGIGDIYFVAGQSNAAGPLISFVNDNYLTFYGGETYK